MATLARPMLAEEATQPGVVKVVLDRGGRALYFSRSLIPFPRSPGEVFPLAHIGLYGFSAETLQHFARLDESNLERAEGLEQLRALWYGLRISVAVGHWTSIAVDTAEDLEKVRGIYLSERRPA
jgi:3-deoxy-manno-octulosonate cytidylyltransferase (CMP-KDO synthetase)